MTDDLAELDGGDGGGVELESGERLHQAIRDWVSDIYDGEPTVIPSFVVIARADDGSSCWVEVGAFGSDGHCLPEWESIGLIEYARRVERREFTSSVADEFEDDEDA